MGWTAERKATGSGVDGLGRWTGQQLGPGIDGLDRWTGQQLDQVQFIWAGQMDRTAVGPRYR